MSSPKFYKLAKSNELSSFANSETIRSLADAISDKLFSIIMKFGEVLVTSIVTFAIEQKQLVAKLLTFITINLNFPLNDTIFTIILIMIIPLMFGLIFLVIDASVKKILAVIKRLDNKRNANDINRLLKIFYDKILNEITIALSLQKRADELNMKAGDDNYINNARLKYIYCCESIFYFKTAYDSMIENRIIETQNDERSNNLILIKELNAFMLWDLISLCLDSQEQIEKHIKEIEAIQSDEGCEHQAGTNEVIELIQNYTHIKCKIAPYRQCR